MTRYLLDTNALADAIFRRRGVHVRAEEARLRGARIGTCSPVVAELLGGIEYSSTRDSNMVIANRRLASIRIWPFELENAREYARRYAILRKTGITVGHIDLMVAATARLLGNCTVVSTDSDLTRIQGLNVENWTTE